MFNHTTNQVNELLQASFDRVGVYNQNRVNGISDELIDNMITYARLDEAETVLDAMGGNGNLIHQIYNFCRKNRLKLPKLSMLEYSQVQVENAQHVLRGISTQLIWGDMLSLYNFTNNQYLEPESFDRVLIKSSNHEISLENQPQLYQNVFKILKPGGIFVNLGFLFDCPVESQEFRNVAKVKDGLMGMESAVKNRHFIIRDNFYKFLNQAGFTDIKACEKFNYKITSDALQSEYFSKLDDGVSLIQYQASQAQAKILRKNGRIIFNGIKSIMYAPGEITFARKPMQS